MAKQKTPQWSMAVKVRYTNRNEPDEKKINQTINNAIAQGYKFRGRDERNSGPSGCIGMLTVPFWKRGWTDLQFIHKDAPNQ